MVGTQGPFYTIGRLSLPAADTLTRWRTYTTNINRFLKHSTFPALWCRTTPRVPKRSFTEPNKTETKKIININYVLLHWALSWSACYRKAATVQWWLPSPRAWKMLQRANILECLSNCVSINTNLQTKPSLQYFIQKTAPSYVYFKNIVNDKNPVWMNSSR